MASFGIGPAELLLMLLLSSGGQPAELTSLLSPQDYFKTRGVEVTVATMADIAVKTPADGKGQLAQLLALRYLSDEPAAFKKSPNYAEQRQRLEQLAAGTKNDPQGFVKEHARRLLALLDGQAFEPRPATTKADDPLAWFPASATLVAALDTRGRGAGPMPQPAHEIFKLLPKEAKQKVYRLLDVLGNLRVDRVALAYIYEEKGLGRSVIRFTGTVNPERLGLFFKELGIKRSDGVADKTIAVYDGGDMGPMFALLGETDLLIAGREDARGKHRDVLDEILAVRDKKKPSVRTGGLKTDLEKVPAKASGLLVGSFSETTRRNNNFLVGAFPAKLVAHVERAGTAVDINLSADFDNAEQARTFVQSAVKLRNQGLDWLKNAPPPRAPGVNLNALQTVLNSLQLETKNAGAQVRLLVPQEVVQMLPAFFFWSAGEAPLPGN